MTIECNLCGALWGEEELLKTEALEHFFAAGSERKIIERSGQSWVVTYSSTQGISKLHRCRRCPTLQGLSAAES